MAAKHLGNSMMENIAKIKKCFMEGVNAVQPHELIGKFVKRDSDALIINNEKFTLKQNVYIVGFGKAVLGMIRPLELLLRPVNSVSHLQEGIVSVPCGIRDTFRSKSDLLPSDDSLVALMEGAKDNIPDEEAFNASKKIVSVVKKLKEDDLLIVLISGGGSALLPYPLPPTTMTEKIEIVKSLSRAGATINELNTVRKALSASKGGKLANMTKASIVSLIISDVINSPLDIIASGPTVVNHDPLGAAINVIEKYNTPIPDHVKVSLQNTLPNDAPQNFPHVTNIIMGSNDTALAAVKQFLSQITDRKSHSVIMTSSLQGEASKVGENIAKFAAEVISTVLGNRDINVIEPLLDDLCVDTDKKHQIVKTVEKVYNDKCPVLFIFGGETTVHVCGNGVGGRNQEMVLSASMALDKKMEGSSLSGEIVFLSGGTDGIDGPTDAAGAITYWKSTSAGVRSQCQEAIEQGLKPQKYLKNNDSYTYFTQLNNGQYLLKPGHTGTNVMDIQILLIVPNS